MRMLKGGLKLTLFMAAASLACAATDKFDPSKPDFATNSGLYLKARLDRKVKLSARKPGDLIEGTLTQTVYSGDREVFASGARLRLTVARRERRRKPLNDHWPWIVRIFAPRHENYPIFQLASVVGSDSRETPLNVSFLSIARERQIEAPHAHGSEVAASGRKSAGEAPGKPGSVVTLQASELRPQPRPAFRSSPTPARLTAGTQAKVVLLSEVSASRSRPGDRFQARLIAPVRVGSTVVLPEGTLLDGRVVKSTPPRSLSRSGSLLLSFTGLSLPGGIASQPIAASPSGAEIDRGSHTRMDAEGNLKGERPGKAWMLIHAGVTAGIAKEVDDGTQLLIEAMVSTATNASTAGVAKIVATAASATFMLTRHGRDVLLPQFTEMDIVFDRSVSLPGSPPAAGEQ